jgi:hypothetical protein
MKKYDKCPKCGCGSLSDQWCKNRMRQQYCYNDSDERTGEECGWVGEPRIPETCRIETTKRLYINSFTGWHYEVYDKYGYIMISSRYFESEEDATYELNSELKKGLKNELAGPYTGVLFNIPTSVVIEGQVFKKH